MKLRLARCLVAALGALLLAGGAPDPAEAAEPPLAHTGFFTLEDGSTQARAKFVASCRKYLTGHEGAVSFAIGTMAEDVEEPGVSVRDYDVSLLVVFASKADEQKYLVHPRHKQFIEENKASFAKVRVFDSYLVAAE